MLYLVDTSIFMDKSATYMNVIYLQYLDDFEAIHEYNWGSTCLVYLYYKLFEGCMWKTKHVTCSITLLAIIFLGILMFVCHFHNTFAISLLMTHMFYFQA